MEWLRDHNSSLKSPNKVGVFGMDIYALHESIDEVLEYLQKVGDDQGAQFVRSKYSRLLEYRNKMDDYRRTVEEGLQNCSADVTEVVNFLDEVGWDYLKGLEPIEEQTALLDAKQNALVVKHAEQYYRVGSFGGVFSWNVRDNAMCELLQSVLVHHQVVGVDKPKCVIWAHNSHLGDARATEWAERDEQNVGQLLRENFGLESTFSILFSTFSGSVTASMKWGVDHQIFELNESVLGSDSELFHRANHQLEEREEGVQDFALVFRSNDATFTVDDDLCRALIPARRQRAVGVVYSKENEMSAHYFSASIPLQADVMIHIENTKHLQL